MPDNIQQELRFDSIIAELKVTGSKQVFQKLSEHVSRLVGTPQKTVKESLLAQEKAQSSGIGQGVAIPHMKLPSLTKPLVIFAKLARPVDFKSSDDEPVDLVCLVLSPTHDGPKHLRRLARTTRFFTDKSFCNQLRSATDIDDIRLIVKEINNRKMAA